MINRGLTLSLRQFGGSKPTGIPSVQDNSRHPDLRDRLHLQEMDEDAKYFLPEHSRVRRPLALYSLFNLLPYFCSHSELVLPVLSVVSLLTLKSNSRVTVYTCLDSPATEFPSTNPSKMAPSSRCSAQPKCCPSSCGQPDTTPFRWLWVSSSPTSPFTDRLSGCWASPS